MAFIDRDEYGSQIVNISNRVGMTTNPFAITGNWDDVVVVQELLELFYQSHSSFINNKPFKIIEVTGRVDLLTIGHIRSFQMMIMKRSMPEGHINRYSGKSANSSTIWKLNNLAQKSLVQMGRFESVADYLKAAHPMLDLNPAKRLSGNNSSTNRERIIQYTS